MGLGLQGAYGLQGAQGALRQRLIDRMAMEQQQQQMEMQRAHLQMAQQQQAGQEEDRRTALQDRAQAMQDASAAKVAPQLMGANIPQEQFDQSFAGTPSAGLFTPQRSLPATQIGGGSQPLGQSPLNMGDAPESAPPVAPPPAVTVQDAPRRLTGRMIGTGTAEQQKSAQQDSQLSALANAPDTPPAAKLLLRARLAGAEGAIPQSVLAPPVDPNAKFNAFKQEHDYKVAHPLPSRAVASGGGTPAEGGLSPDAVAYTATQYRILGPAGIPTRIEARDREHILNEAASQAKALGQTPAIAVQKQAAYKSDAASLTQMRKMSSSAESFETKALGQADIVGALSEKVGRTNLPILNRAILEGKKDLLGDTDTQLLYNAITTFTSEYAKIMEGSTGSVAASSDSARKASERLINAGLSKGTMKATVDLMKKEMRLTIDGYGATINHITDRMGGSAPQEPAATTPAPGAVRKYNPATGKVE